MKLPYRTGFGFDIHAFAENRKLILGGIEIPHTHGLIGHSDADVLIHAICDAMLGAIGESDIGKYFPDTAAVNKDRDSAEFLVDVLEMVKQKGYSIGNIDSMLAIEKPKISPFIPAMKEKLCRIIGCEPDQLSIKASTTEKLGFVGRGEGVTAFANVLLVNSSL